MRVTTAAADAAGVASVPLLPTNVTASIAAAGSCHRCK